jgi:N4-gp56 family major capsid protein
MAASTTTTLDDLFSNIIKEAIFVSQETSLVRNLVSIYDISGEQGKVVQVPVYAETSAAALTEGTDMSSTAISTSSVSITVAEAGVQALLTDMAAKSAMGDVAGDLGRILGEAVSKKMDEDLIGLFTGFSAGQGTAAQEITVADIFKAAAVLRVNNAGSVLNAVIHPYQAYQLKSNLTNAFANPNGGDLQNEAMRAGYVGTIAGVNIFESSNVAIDGSGDAIGALFAPAALGLAIKWDINIEPQRDASLRGWELNATASYGVGELVDTYGQKLTFDAAL